MIALILSGIQLNQQPTITTDGRSFDSGIMQYNNPVEYEVYNLRNLPVALGLIFFCFGGHGTL